MLCMNAKETYCKAKETVNLRMYVFVNVCMCECVYVCMCVCVYVCMCVCVHVCMCVCMCICVYVYVCMYVYVCACVHMCVYVYRLTIFVCLKNGCRFRLPGSASVTAFELTWEFLNRTVQGSISLNK